MTIYRGANKLEHKIGEFCGQEIPGVILSSTNAALLHFQSNWFDDESSGFLLVYHHAKGEDIPWDIFVDGITGLDD